MTVENTLPHGLKTSILDTDYETEDKENLALLDKHRIQVGLFANRPAVGVAERFFYATDTGDLYYDDGTSWLGVADVISGHATSHAVGGSDALTHQNLSGAGSNSHAEVDTHISDGSKHFALLDEDDMASDDATKAASQQSVKAYCGLSQISGIINGLGEVFQRTAAVPLVKDVYAYATDRMASMATGTLVTAGTATQSTVAPCGRTGLAHHLSDVTLTGTGVVYFRYRVESKDALKWKNQKGTFNAKIYHDVAGSINYTVTLRKPTTTADDFSAVTDIASSGALSKATATELDLSFANVSMGDCSKGIEIEVKIECGAITTKNFYITEFDFKTGNVVIPYQFWLIGKELSACQRYYTRFNYPIQYDQCGSGDMLDTNLVSWNIPLPVEMRAIPTLTASDAATHFSLRASNTYLAISALFNTNRSTKWNFGEQQGVVATGTSGWGGTLVADIAGAWIAGEAEL